MFSRESLVDSLRGKEVVLPDLFKIFSGPRWVAVPPVNPGYRKLVAETDRRLESIFNDPRILKKLKAADFANFVCVWWPKARPEELTNLMYYCIWLFTWDDSVDEPTGDYSSDMAGADVYRAQTSDFIRKCLGFPSNGSGLPPTQNRLITSFQEFGEAVAKVCTLEQRKRLLHEIEGFLEATKQEQEYSVANEIPTPGEYWNYRMGTAGVSPTVACLEYGMRVQISDSVLNEDERVRAISDETVIMVVICNDLLSLRKEVAKGCIDSIVPLLCAQGLSVQQAVESALATLKASKKRFDVAADSLRRSAQREPVKYKHISEWIEGCQYYCLGNTSWSLMTDRYGVNNGSTTCDGGVRFTL